MHFITLYSLSFAVSILGNLYQQHIVQPTAPGRTEQQMQQQEKLKGAWQLSSGTVQFATLPKGATAVAMMEDGYFTVAYFDKAGKQFLGTFGGTYTLAADDMLTREFEYNTLDTATVGTQDTLMYTLQNGQLQLTGDNLKQTWARADKNTASPLEGTWRITGRAGEDGKVNPIHTSGPRKTLKILSGNRFQWIAFNTETKEFSGTGGGTYTAENGKYTEHIEFFSRDSSRVGASLGFNYKVEDGKWLHSGQSSTGKKINEVWERE
ncbi:membrane or secreted protein [Pontibacter anaerobius]|uniref:Membrane or secreted protein n=1 Tax=Pontibacter anaerobius TaxID=2993940 RepID=A0ABT3RC77_9BACT|nr:membrane or secreted protein [Pontibacter anaerobius]MCX2739044.1 membrane or secreted protein [Pontibacter anaerobius]